MKKLSLIIAALLWAAPFVMAEPCPCAGGTMPYTETCGGGGTANACADDDCCGDLGIAPTAGWECCGNAEFDPAVDECCEDGVIRMIGSCDPEPCKNGEPASQGKECCGGMQDGEEYDPDWKGIGVTQSFTADPALVGKINSAVNLIPGINITLQTAKGSVSGDKKDCCGSGSVQTDGIGYAEGNLTVSGNLADLTIIGPPTVSRIYDFTVVEVEVDFNVGLKFTADLYVQGTGGSRWDQCGGESCNYGSFSVGVSPTIALTIEVIACVETWFTSKKCVDLQVTPASLTASLSGSITSGNKDACLSGVTGDVTLSSIQANATFRVSEYEVSYTTDIYPTSS